MHTLTAPLFVQAGQHNAKRHSYGHALIVDPWGKVIAQLEVCSHLRSPVVGCGGGHTRAPYPGGSVLSDLGRLSSFRLERGTLLHTQPAQIKLTSAPPGCAHAAVSLCCESFLPSGEEVKGFLPPRSHVEQAG